MNVPDSPANRPLSAARLGAPGLLLLCLIAFFWRLGSVPLFDLDEALYVTCAKQMVLTGDLVTPRLNSRPHFAPDTLTVPFFEKPILVYWAAAAGMRLFGFHEWAARLPVALAALLTTLLIAAIGSRWFGRRAGLLAGMVYATAPMTIADARQMTTDSLLVLWFTLGLIAFWRCREQERAGSKPTSPLAVLGKALQPSLYSGLFWSALALAVLTKGIIGLLLPSLVIGVFLTFNRWITRKDPDADWWRSLLGLRPIFGLALFLALAAPWHILIAQTDERDAQGRTFYQEYIVRQHIGRFKGGDTVHNLSFVVNIFYFLVGFFPWACFTPAGFRRGATYLSLPYAPDASAPSAPSDSPDVAPTNAAGEINPPLLFVVPPPSAVKPDVTTAGEAYRFLLVWFWTIFVFFSLVAAKLPTYLVPAYPAAALLVGRWLDRALAVSASGGSAIARSLRRGALATFFTAGILLMAALLAPQFVPARSPVPPEMQRFLLTVILVLFFGCGSAWLLFWRGEGVALRRHLGVAVLAVMMLGMILIVCTRGYAIIEQSVLDPYQRLARAARADAERGLPVVFYHIIPRRPSMLFYAGYSPLERKETPLLPFLQSVLPPGQSEADVITSHASLKSLLAPELRANPAVSYRILAESGGQAGGWALLRLPTRENWQNRSP